MTYPLTAIISDLHGNVPALDVALRDALGRGVERFVCLGDVVGYGAKPRECLDRVMRLCDEEAPAVPADLLEEGAEPPELRPGFCLLGNHEYALLYDADDFNPRARSAILWTKDEISRGDAAYWNWIGELEPARCDDVAMFAHGSPRDPVREYMLPRDVRDERKMEAVFRHMDRRVCFVGHSHVPAVYFEDRRLYRPRDSEGPYDLGDVDSVRVLVNVGSVGQPRDRDQRLSYVVFDGDTITFVRLAYDVERAMADIRAVPELPTYLADRLAQGI